MKKYLLPEQGTFYKTCLHTHSTMSDGKLEPEEVKKLYQSKGYSCVAFTDHDLLMPEEHLSDESFVALNAFELQPRVDHKTEKKIHMNLIAKDPKIRITRCFNFAAFTPGHPVDDVTVTRIPQEQKEIELVPLGTSIEAMNRIIEEAKKEGFLVTLNHPAWSNLTYPEYICLKGLWGVEVFNTGCLFCGTPESLQPAYELWTQKELVIPVAADDMHRQDRAGRGWMMVKAPELTYDAIIHALEVGDCYASTGPEITSLTIENNILHVETKEEAEVITVSFTKHPKHKNALNTNVFELDLTTFLEDPKNQEGFISVYVRDRQDRQAWSRAYTVKELTEA